MVAAICTGSDRNPKLGSNMTTTSKATPKTSKPSPRLVPVESSRFGVYQAAARLLKQVLETDAPDALALINHELGGRHVKDIAEDYLDCTTHHTLAYLQKQRQERDWTAGRKLRMKQRRVSSSLKLRAAPAVPGRN